MRLRPINIVFAIIAILMVSCHRTAPQSPSQRSGSETKGDTSLLALLQFNHRMADHADKEVLAIVDSVRNTDNVDFAEMSCGGWKMRRDSITKQQGLYADNPKMDEHWTVHILTFDLHGHQLLDTEKVYKIKRYEIPVAVEEAIEDMFEGETTVVYTPWYNAYGAHGNQYVPPYTNIRFVITLKAKE